MLSAIILLAEACQFAVWALDLMISRDPISPQPACELAALGDAKVRKRTTGWFYTVKFAKRISCPSTGF
jgi:hypothetical protein